jgi:hypothetical protein
MSDARHLATFLQIRFEASNSPVRRSVAFDGTLAELKMTTILAFPSRGRPWSSSEREVLDQIHRAFSDHGLMTNCEHGVTDEGDPWAAYHETAEGAFVAHIARIGVAYLLVWADGTSVRAASLYRLAKAARHGRAHAA